MQDTNNSNTLTFEETMQKHGITNPDVIASLKATAEMQFGRNTMAGRAIPDYKHLIAGHKYVIASCACQTGVEKSTGKLQNWSKQGSHTGMILFVTAGPAGGHGHGMNIGYLLTPSKKTSTGIVKGPYVNSVAYSKFYDYHEFVDMGNFTDDEFVTGAKISMHYAANKDDYSSVTDRIHVRN